MNYQGQGNMNDNYDFGEDEDFEGGFQGGFNNKPPNFRNNYRNDRSNDRYNNAYGNYSGGYGPPGGYGNNRNFGGPRDNFYGRNNYGHPPQPPPLFQGTSNVWGRGFGPGGPPFRKNPMDDKAIRYLQRCGVAREHLKNLPRDLLDLITPDYCGICAQSFDSFAMSRIHYISKNHLKNQKKFLQSDMAFHRSKEIPLKSRELYCELCDVHITSKVHSESHYAGKAHRSIVEGRKNPRNPFLLQDGMEDRVEQLIRREKKFLKPLDDEESGEKKEPKIMTSELYCDICKTSVTCTDQMTMHLNGKRHLAKEKQHILKMMKGESANTGAEQDEEEYDEEEEEVEKEAEDNTQEKDFDWENGEKWEDA